MEKSCLTCVYLCGDPWSATHKYCGAEPNIPACATMRKESIDPEAPHMDCPIWQADPVGEGAGT